jgi:hypothetical protein
MKKKYKIVILFFGLSLASIVTYILIAESDREKTIIERISRHSEHVIYYSQLNNIDPRVYISIVYGELSSNMNFFDEFDNIRADFGYDPSVGFGQMRVSTFMWIEHKYADGINIIKSKDDKELVTKIKDDITNIAYTTFYVGLIYKKIRDELNIEPSVKLLGSYYSLGIDHGKRKINPDFTSPVGEAAEEFYYSVKLLNQYPRK